MSHAKVLSLNSRTFSGLARALVCFKD